MDRRDEMDPKSRSPNGRETKQGGRRTKTFAARYLKRIDFSDGFEIDEDLDALRPKTRADCINGPRPCPWVGCKYHLYLDVNPKTGSIKINFPDIEPWEMEVSCVLDVADGGPVTLDEIGRIMNLTRERIRQLEKEAAVKLQRTALAMEYRDYIIEGKKSSKEGEEQEE